MGGVIRDPFGRVLDYVRISVTDRCNFRCGYCMPADGVKWIPHDRIMTYEDILFLCGVLRELGVRRIRFTGGEPFVRKGFVPFLSQVCRQFEDLAIAVTTNGSFLEQWAPSLSALNLDGVNVSLDTLDSKRFAKLTGHGDLTTVLRGIDALLGAGGVPVKLNTVVMRSFNLQEIGRMVRYAQGRGLLLRFIEFMPLDSFVWRAGEYVPAREIRESLPDPEAWSPWDDGNDSPRGPARYYRHRDSGQVVGVISAVSEHFCSLCNRLRVTATGEFRPCLFRNTGVPIIEELRRRDREGLRRCVLASAWTKPREGETGIRGDGEDMSEERHMSQIGG